MKRLNTAKANQKDQVIYKFFFVALDEIECFVPTVIAKWRFYNFPQAIKLP